MLSDDHLTKRQYPRKIRNNAKSLTIKQQEDRQQDLQTTKEPPKSEKAIARLLTGAEESSSSVQLKDYAKAKIRKVHQQYIGLLHEIRQLLTTKIC